jgi:hypothetical protein
MERFSNDQWIEVHRRPERDHGVYIELYGLGRDDQSECHGHGDGIERLRNSYVDLGATHTKY